MTNFFCMLKKKPRILSCCLNISIEEADVRLAQCLGAGRLLNVACLFSLYYAQTEHCPLILRQKEKFQGRQQKGEP